MIYKGLRMAQTNDVVMCLTCNLSLGGESTLLILGLVSNMSKSGVFKIYQGSFTWYSRLPKLTK